MSTLSKLRRAVSAHLSRAKFSSKIARALILAAAAAALAAPIEVQAAGKLRVETKEGPVNGFLVNGVTEYLGIPYAEPPVGILRWMPPKKHGHWTNVLQAKAYAPICAQITTLGAFAGPPNNNEDCLYLNVFTPNLDPSAKLPVIVWIHGGANVDGGTPGYDGSKMASDGKTVVVTLAYRLNLMGWFAHPALDNEGHYFGNYGILDQQAALKWVRRNIAKFGGDKNNVTLGGQSAGAADTSYNMVSPLAKGLFQRAICESWCSPRTLSTTAAAEAKGIAFSVAAGCGSGTDAATAKCLRSLTAAQVEALAGTESAQSQYIAGVMLDPNVIPIQQATAFATGQYMHIPVMNGNTEDEWTFFLGITEYFSGPPRVPPTAAQYLNYVNTTYATPHYPAGTAAKVLANYPLSAFASPLLAWNRLVTDTTICSQRALDKILAPNVPLYTYEFDDQTAPLYFPKMPDFVSLAYHTSDIQYLFPLWHGGPAPPSKIHPLNKKQTALSDQLVTAWTNFAWTGNPNGVGNYPWPRYTNSPTKPQWLIQDIPAMSTVTDPQYAALRKCDFWDAVTASLNP
ncbi:Carboxylic ester hydrolase [Methylocella tundrae]|nr:Carboxylic ester hydrolase [Methylocella tundrae]